MKKSILSGLFIIACIAAVLIFIDRSNEKGGEDENSLQRAEVQGQGQDGVLRFGFDPRGSLQEDTRQYLPFLKYLEEETGYRFDLRFTPVDGKLDEDLANGIVDIAAIGAVSYLSASNLGSVMPIVRGLNKNNKAEYQSVIVVAPDSSISSIDDLRGKKVAFGSVDSTQGHIIPRLSLDAAGISIDDFASYEYTGSHQNCADAVISGSANACALQDTLGKALESEGAVKIVYESKNYPSSGIAVNTRLAPEAIKKVTQALIAFDPTGKHAEGLYNWVRTEMPNGFKAATESDYAELRASMKKLGFLK